MFYWLLLKDGRTVIGVDRRPYSYATLDSGGGMGAVNPLEVMKAVAIREPESISRARLSLLQNLPGDAT